MSVVLLVFSLKILLTSPVITDTIKILRSLNFRVVFLTQSKRRARAYLPKEVEVFEAALSGVLSKQSNNMFLNWFFFLFEQMLVSLSLLRLHKKFDLVIFSHCLMPLPVLLSRLLAKSPLVYVGGIPISIRSESNTSRRAITILENLYYRWSKGILVVTCSLVKRPPLRKYSKKVFEAPIRFCDKAFLERFSYSQPSDRKNVVGFVSRLSWEKGVLEFVMSIPHIISRRGDVNFLIVGDGPLKDTVLEKIGSPEVEKRVAMVPWTNDPGTYLKRIKLLILPSRSEGMPSIVLEAMACGTPVLVTRVGGLAGLFDDGTNAFLLDNTEAEYIARRVLEILERPDLNDVSRDAYSLLISHYNEEKILADWRSAFEAISTRSVHGVGPVSTHSMALTP